MERELDERRFMERESALEKTALERVNYLKTELLRTVSHEMRTPLAVMMGFAELTAEEVRKGGMGEKISANLDTIAAEARNMNIMLEEFTAPLFVQEFAKDMRRISAGEVIRKIANLYEKVLEQKNIRFVLELAENLPPIYGNEHELTQVMFNLLRNADKYTQDGEIAVHVNVEPETKGGGTKENHRQIIVVAVKDTGKGISPELLPHVFERGTSGEKGGMGFGLAICRDIIEAHGGRISIDSELGKGTVVSFALPVYAGGGEHVE